MGENQDQGQRSNPHGPGDEFTDSNVYSHLQRTTMPFPSQLMSMNPSYPSQHVQRSPVNVNQNLYNPGDARLAYSAPRQEVHVQSRTAEPYIRPYPDFPHGSTIGDPVSVEEKGRRWQNYRPDKYFLPNDATEQDRLDFVHKGWCILMHALQASQAPQDEALEEPQDVLYLAPIKGDPPRVLDIGTGTGKFPPSSFS
jgi:hypothetical protein